jgi:hypothetical protein
MIDELLRLLLTGERSDLNGVFIGSSNADVRSRLGEPEHSGHGWWRYSGFSVRLVDGGVTAIRVSHSDLAGRLNIVTEQDLIGLTGPPATRIGCRNRLTLSFPERDRSVSITLSPFTIEAIVLQAGGHVMRDQKQWMFADGYFATVEFVELDQVYGGLLEGLPTDKMNDSAICKYVDAAKQRFSGLPVHLVNPPRTPIEHDGRYPFGTPERLPSTVCTARFGSRSCARKMSMDGSSLVVVWFQETMEFPGDRDRFASVRWRELAGDFEW